MNETCVNFGLRFRRATGARHITSSGKRVDSMLKKLITPAALAKLAGVAAFAKGQAYFSSGAVRRLRTLDSTVTAKVDGTESYRVELREHKRKLAAECTCPRAADGYFCKHCVAVGLAWIADGAEEDTATPAAGKTPVKARGRTAKSSRRDPWRAITAYLEAQGPKALIGLLLDVMQRDDTLYRSLLIKAEAETGDDSNSTLRRVIDTATEIDGFVDWREVAGYARSLDEVVDALAPLLKSGGAERLIPLAEYAIGQIESALESIDDSNGEVSSVVERLGELHRQACAKASPEPVALAERLFRLETTLPFGLCRFDATTYQKTLGATGLRRYRELAEAEWHSFKPLDQHSAYDSRRAAITRLMEDVVKATGSVDDLVAVKSKDLSSGYQYLGIAELLAKSRRADDALHWAERGLKAFPDRPDPRLRDFLVTRYLKLKRNDEAVQLVWLQFEESPGLETYKKLHGIADKLDIWPAQRTRALALVEQQDAAPVERRLYAGWGYGRSLRLAIALWENDLDAAWAASRRGAHTTDMLITLAGKLEAARADDALTLYREVVPPIIQLTGNEAYADAVKLVRKIGALMEKQRRQIQFGDYLAGLRVEFKAKRNFIKLLDRVEGG